MFGRKKTFRRRLKFDGKAFNEIVRSLRLAGFTDIEIRIPEKGYESFEKKSFSPEEFINQKYNFVAQILTAKNKDETIKILFINYGKTLSPFDDKIFPSGHSVNPSFYIETLDPARLIGLEDFVQELLVRNSSRGVYFVNFFDFIFIICSLYLFVIAMAITGRVSTENFYSYLFQHPFYFFLIPIIAIIYLLFYTISPGGLYVAPFEHPLVSFYRRISAGDLRNNLIVASIVWIFKVLIAGVLITLLSNVISDIAGEQIANYLRTLFK